MSDADKTSPDPYSEGFRDGLTSVRADVRRSECIAELVIAHRRMSGLGERDDGVVSTLHAMERAIRRMANAIERVVPSNEP